MSAASRIIAAQGLKRRALSLGVVKSFDHAMQFVLPVILVRCLDAATFGEYRLLWLALGTVLTVTLNMGGALYFFVPRAEPRRKRLYIHNTMAYLAGAGLLAGLAVSPWNPLLPAAMAPLAPYGALVPAFVALWVLAMLLDYLPTVEERIGWQAAASMSVAALRVVLVGFGAWASGELETILWMLLALVLLKIALLLAYVHRFHGLGRPWLERRTFGEQFRHAAPFGVANALFSLRAQADQWVAASLFALSSFAAFSIAAIVGQVVQVFRHSVMEAFMPSMSRLEAGGDVRGMLEMNRRANVLVGRLLYPLLAFAFVFAEDLVRLVYTAAYTEAVPAMRVYLVGMAAMVIELASTMLLLRQGPFVLRLTAFTLAVSVLVSWSAAHAFGLAGAAAGSVLAIYIDRALILRRLARCSEVPFSAVQDWRALGAAAACAAAGGLAAWFAAARLVPDDATLARLALGAAVVGLSYAALQWRRVRA